jgi:hypothetical protein
MIRTVALSAVVIVGFRQSEVAGLSAASAIVVSARRLVGCDAIACQSEVVVEELGQPQPGDRRAVGQQ